MKNLKMFGLLLFFVSASLFPYYVQYKEQYYKLFHVHYQQNPDDVIENIYWLEKATKADFCNPQNAMAKINDKDEWEKYRYLFMMHINLKLVEQHLQLARIYDKNEVHFYDKPWKNEYLNDFNNAHDILLACKPYWEEAKIWAEKASVSKFAFLTLYQVQNWEDECAMIREGTIDYGKTIINEFSKLSENTAKMSALSDEDY